MPGVDYLDWKQLTWIFTKFKNMPINTSKAFQLTLSRLFVNLYRNSHVKMNILPVQRPKSVLTNRVWGILPKFISRYFSVGLFRK